MNKITKEDIKHFLKNHYIMQLSTVSDDQPGVSVLLYIIDEDLNFYFCTHKNSFKIKNLTVNPKVSLVVWEFGKIQVQVNGVTETVLDETVKEDTLDKLADAATNDKEFWPPFLKIDGDEYTIIKIKPTWMRVLDLSNNNVKQKESPFTEITL